MSDADANTSSAEPAATSGGPSAANSKNALRLVVWLIPIGLIVAIAAVMYLPGARVPQIKVFVNGKQLTGEKITLKIAQRHTIRDEYQYAAPNVPADKPNKSTDTVDVVVTTGTVALRKQAQLRARIEDQGRVLSFSGALPHVTKTETCELWIQTMDYSKKNKRGGYTMRTTFKNPIEFVK